MGPAPPFPAFSLQGYLQPLCKCLISDVFVSLAPRASSIVTDATYKILRLVSYI